jgi:hypothetical protein
VRRRHKAEDCCGLHYCPIFNIEHCVFYLFINYAELVVRLLWFPSEYWKGSCNLFNNNRLSYLNLVRSVELGLLCQVDLVELELPEIWLHSNKGGQISNCFDNIRLVVCAGSSHCLIQVLHRHAHAQYVLENFLHQALNWRRTKHRNAHQSR